MNAKGELCEIRMSWLLEFRVGVILCVFLLDPVSVPKDKR